MNDRDMNYEKTRRKQYWEIASILKCPVVGTCLSLREQKKILKRAGYAEANLSDHEIHEILVESARSEGSISRRVQRALENKFREQITELGESDEEIFMKHWQKGLRRGEIEGLLWIGVTNPKLSPLAMTRIFNDYHMHMHGQGEIIREQLQEVDQLRDKNQQLAKAVKQTSAEKKQMAQALQAAQKESAALQREVQALQNQNQSLQNRPRQERLQQANNAMKSKMQQLESKLQAQSESLAFLKAENSGLSAQLLEQAKINQLLQTELEQLVQEASNDNSACVTCPQRNLCACRVLFVGGLNCLRPHYQNLVESGGGEFKYYDPHYGGTERALRPMIGWADVILCPIDFNSHRNCLSVKQLCKKMYKPYYMLPNSSISCIDRVLAEVSTEVIPA